MRRVYLLAASLGIAVLAGCYVYDRIQAHQPKIEAEKPVPAVKGTLTVIRLEPGKVDEQALVKSQLPIGPGKRCR